MNRPVDRVNRFFLFVIGAVLTAAGGLGLALSFGAFGSGRAEQAVVDDAMSAFAADNAWFWWAVAGACLLVALLALWWLLSQLRNERLGRLDVTADEREGRTVVHSGAVTDAVEAELEGFLGVHRASASLRGLGHPRLDVTVDLDEHADLADIRRRIEQQTAPRARQALDVPTLPISVELRPAVGGRALLT